MSAVQANNNTFPLGQRFRRFASSSLEHLGIFQPCAPYPPWSTVHHPPTNTHGSWEARGTDANMNDLLSSLL